ncbi:MAG TPA: ABC transporter substrate-binding protein [Stellaceae bacterium]|nr:ABC transporter substrate-binding protein [Stellaceae bacterium]
MKVRLNVMLRVASSVVALMAGISVASAQETHSWRHGIVQAKSDAGIVMMAKHKGFDKDQHLDLDIVQFTGDSLALKALIAGEIDSYDGSPGGPMLAASHGADVKIVGCYWPGLTYGIYSKDNLKSVQDLKGRTLAISGPGSLPDLLARGILSNAGITPSEVKFAQMGSDTDRIKAITAGVVDAGAASLEFINYAKTLHIKLLVNAHDAVPQFIRFCTMTSSNVLKTRKDDLAHYLAAQMEGTRYALDHRDETLALTRETTKAPASDPRAADLFDQVVKINAVVPEMPIPVDRLAWMQDLLMKTGNLKVKQDLTKLVDNSARVEALGFVHKQKH